MPAAGAAPLDHHAASRGHVEGQRCCRTKTGCAKDAPGKTDRQVRSMYDRTRASRPSGSPQGGSPGSHRPPRSIVRIQRRANPHVYWLQRGVALCHCSLSGDLQDIAKRVPMESPHRGQIGGQSFAASLLQLLDQELDVGCDCFLHCLLFMGRRHSGGSGVLVVVFAAVV